MQIRFVLPPTVDSPLARLDSRWRLLGLVLLLVGVATLRTLTASLAGLGIALVLAVIARPPRRWMSERLLEFGVVLAVFVVPVPLFASGELPERLRLASVLAAKALSLFVLSSVLLVTAPLERTLASAGALGVPRLLTHLTQMSLRYLFLIGEELARLRIALRVRGFRNRPGLHSYRTIAAATGMLLVRGNARAVRVAHAMRCRGFEGQFHDRQTTTTMLRDVVFFALALATLVSIVLLDFWLYAGGEVSS